MKYLTLLTLLLVLAGCSQKGTPSQTTHEEIDTDDTIYYIDDRRDLSNVKEKASDLKDKIKDGGTIPRPPRIQRSRPSRR